MGLCRIESLGADPELFNIRQGRSDLNIIEAYPEFEDRVDEFQDNLDFDTASDLLTMLDDDDVVLLVQKMFETKITSGDYDPILVSCGSTLCGILEKEFDNEEHV